MTHTLNFRKAAVACLLFGVLAAVSPASAVPYTGIVRFASPGPSGQQLNEALPSPLGNGTFGFELSPAGLGGKSFTLAYASSAPIVQTAVTEVYLVDLDVYFYNPAGYVHRDGKMWDNETGVTPGDETGTIPAGTQKVFITISPTTPTANHVQFTFTVS